jgi:hypothetical protein
MHAELQIDINQEVNVIRHNLGLNQDAVRLLLGDDPPESPIDAFDQNRAPVFRAKKLRGTCTKRRRCGSIDNPSMIR